MRKWRALKDYQGKSSASQCLKNYGFRNVTIRFYDEEVQILDALARVNGENLASLCRRVIQKHALLNR
jgi:hypothetical protein